MEINLYNIIIMVKIGIINKIKRGLKVFHPTRGSFASCGTTTVIEFPIYINRPQDVYLENDLRIRQGTKMLISEDCKVFVKKFSVVGMNNMIIPNKHVSTVGIPQFLLGSSRINDQIHDIIIEEDVWTGSNVTLMGDVTLGRGCICGACSLVTKSVPPYAVVAGSPAKIIAVKFSIEQIIEHEKILYSENERLSREYLEELFNKYYMDKKVFGVSTEFTEEQVERLKYIAELRDFSDKEYIDRITKTINK